MDLSLNRLMQNNLAPQQSNNSLKGNEFDNNSAKGQKPFSFPPNFDESSLMKNNVKQEDTYSKDGSEENLKDFQIPSKWEWLPCNYELKKEADGIETHWSLAPTIQLAGGDPKITPIMDISLNLDRNFMHSEELGWNWHKSWNLPNITCSIKITDPKTNEVILPPADLKAQLLAVKVLLNKAEQFKLYDLGLKGPAIQDLSEGQAVFSGIKFSSTSYNNDGVKFHLIVLIYIQDDARSRACPKILYSRISPPIFVDSRKSARDSNMNKKVVHKYFDPFPPETFDRTFVKRNSKFNESKEEIIENSLEGLSQYFTAPNIRNKVKHPIFLTTKFSNCVKLYYNTQLLKTTDIKEEELIEKMQRIFMESHLKAKGKNDSNNTNKAFDNKYFILLIEEPNNMDSFHLNKKISDYLDPIINDVLHVIFNSNITPPHFKELSNEKLAKAYMRVYPSLIQMKNAYSISGHQVEEGEKVKKTPQNKIRSVVCLSEDVNKKRDRGELSDSEEEEPKEDTPEPISNKKVKQNSDNIIEQAIKKAQNQNISTSPLAVQQKDILVKNEEISQDVSPKENVGELENIKKLLNAVNLGNMGGNLNLLQGLNANIGKQTPNSMAIESMRQENKQDLQNVLHRPVPLTVNPQPQQPKADVNELLATLQQEQLKNQLLMSYLNQFASQPQSVIKPNLLQQPQTIQQEKKDNMMIPETQKLLLQNNQNLLKGLISQPQAQTQTNMLNNLNNLNNLLMMNRSAIPNTNTNNNLSLLQGLGGLSSNNIINSALANLATNNNSNNVNNSQAAQIEKLLRMMNQNPAGGQK